MSRPLRPADFEKWLMAEPPEEFGDVFISPMGFQVNAAVEVE